MQNNEFNNGIWASVQFLVISHKETELAKYLIKDSGLSKKECLICQELSDYDNDIMYDFIDKIFK